MSPIKSQLSEKNSSSRKWKYFGLRPQQTTYLGEENPGKLFSKKKNESKNIFLQAYLTFKKIAENWIFFIKSKT